MIGVTTTLWVQNAAEYSLVDTDGVLYARYKQPLDRGSPMSELIRQDVVRGSS